MSCSPKRRPAAWASALLLALTPGLVAAQVCTPSVSGSVVTPGTLHSVVLYNTTLYGADDDGGIVSVDVGDETAPTVIGSTSTQGEANELVLEFFRRQIVVADGSAGAAVYTIQSDGSLLFGGQASLGGTAVTVAGSSSSGYLVGTAEGTVHTIAVDSTGGPTAAGSLDVGSSVHDVAISLNNRGFVASDDGLVLIDLSDRSAPEVVTTLDLGGAVEALSFDNNVLYCAVAGEGLVSVQVQGDALLQLASLQTPATATGVLAWGGRVYVSMVDEGFVIVDSSLGRDMLQLAQVDLAGAAAMELASNLLYVATGDAGLTVVDISACASAGVALTTRFIPAAARATGAANTYWVTDVAVANLSAATATFNVAYLPKNTANATPDNLSMAIQPGEQLLVRDVFDSVFERTSGNGALRFVTSHPDVKITSRTYNAAGEAGTYGQFIPALTKDAAIEPGFKGALAQLQQNAGFRTNIGVVNITPIEVDIEIGLYLGDGSSAGVVTQTMQPYEMRQWDKIFTTVGMTDVDQGYAIIKVLTETGKVVGYASVVDNGSGDPIYIPAELLSAGTPFGD